MEATAGRRSLVVPAPPARLTAAERIRLLLEILVTYARARWWLARLDVTGAVAAARSTADDGAVALAPDQAMRLGAAVQRTLAVLPFDGKCLVRSLVVARMLARRGTHATFVFGVRAKPSFIAHAWLERDGVALLPTGPEFERILEL